MLSLLSVQIHIIDFDDENNIINKNVLLHQVGEIWHISASPADKGVLATCYSKSKCCAFVRAARGRGRVLSLRSADGLARSVGSAGCAGVALAGKLRHCWRAVQPKMEAACTTRACSLSSSWNSDPSGRRGGAMCPRLWNNGCGRRPTPISCATQEGSRAGLSPVACVCAHACVRTATTGPHPANPSPHTCGCAFVSCRCLPGRAVQTPGTRPRRSFPFHRCQ